jgi:glycosyltransferase involved in cell wall biosynthesis
MTNPTVCAIMLTRDRPELAKRAIECFGKQTYKNKRLYILDQSFHRLYAIGTTESEPGVFYDHCTQAHFTIGSLRNAAIAQAGTADIIVHFDDDDWSHPNRIAEQVVLLQATGADCVGYNEMLFWRTFPGAAPVPCPAGNHLIFVRKSGSIVSHYAAANRACTANETQFGEAWLYNGTRGGVPALGTSLCYWRKTWERHHFANETQGVEDHWLREKNVVGVSVFAPGKDPTSNPRMIARIHGGNTSNAYDLEKHVAQGSREWKRVPSWDARVREILA